MKKSLLLIASVFCLTACSQEVAFTNESPNKSIKINTCHNVAPMPNVIINDKSIKMPQIVLQDNAIKMPEPAPCSNTPKKIKSLEQLEREAEFL